MNLTFTPYLKCPYNIVTNCVVSEWITASGRRSDPINFQADLRSDRRSEPNTVYYRNQPQHLLLLLLWRCLNAREPVRS